MPEEYTIIHSEKADDVRRWATVTARTRDKRDKNQRTTQLRCLGDGGAVARANAGYLYVLRKGDCGRTEEEAF